MRLQLAEQLPQEHAMVAAHSMAQHSMAQDSTAQHSTAWPSIARATHCMPAQQLYIVKLAGYMYLNPRGPHVLNAE